MAHGYTQMSRFAVMSNASRLLQRIAFILLCIQGSISAHAQQNWFLYIQSESSQSFYVRIGETIYSSSPVGHLVINGLHDSTYRLAIGFPQSQYREHQFAIPVKRKDHGFELKKSDARSWVLYDWQAQETIKSPRSDSLLYGERKRDDGFATLMAAVVNDSAVLYTSVVKAEPVKKIEKAIADAGVDSVALAKQNERLAAAKKADSLAKDSVALVQNKSIADSIAAEQAVVKTSAPKPDSVVKKDTTSTIAPPQKDTMALVTTPPVQEEKTPQITKLTEQTANQEKKLVFLDNSIGIKKDTITVIIPLEKDTVAEVERSVVKTAPPVDSLKVKRDTVEQKKEVVVSKEKTEPVNTNSGQSLMDSIASSKKTAMEGAARAEMKKTDSSVLVAKDPEPERPVNLVMINRSEEHTSELQSPI